MCGIAGILSSTPIAPAEVHRMIAPIAHRGPDDDGVWVDEGRREVGLGHLRLAIVDLTAAGHQPMHSADGRFVLTFNGEIYNHAEVREQLEQVGAVPEGGWRGHSDTETLVEAISTWGVVETLSKVAGMFAFALWDRKERTLSLVRDRFGEKPLYYGWAGRAFVFGSELKALRAHPDFEAEIDRRALGLFAARTYIPAPFSIYKRVFKLVPGCILTLTPEAARTPLEEPPEEAESGGIRLQRYWSYRSVVEAGLGDLIEDEREATDRLEQVLAKAIQQQSMADVPVGAFLSGGIDSSTIVALYQKYSSVPVRTFSIGFEEAGYNEAEDAKAVAAYLGTVHHGRYVTIQEAREVIPLLPSMYDEPFADSSQIPTYLVSRFAREKVTVALTGDGGDELFGGYNRHVSVPQLWRRLNRLPQPLRSAIGTPLALIPSQVWDGAAGLVYGRSQPNMGRKIQKGLRVAGSARSFDELCSTFLDEWNEEGPPVRGTRNAKADMDALAEAAPDAMRIMYRDAISYLPDDILCKVDRASMAVSLETRVPFLDHNVAALAARLPMHMKIRGGLGKAILRRLLHEEVPRRLVDRPKAGFAVPVGEWIKGPLRPWAEDLLNPSRLAREGWFEPALVQRRWREHLEGRRDSTAALWAVLMFQAWLREQRIPLHAAA